jgi:hypothetical protein
MHKKFTIWILMFFCFGLVLSAQTTKVPEPKIPFKPKSYICYRTAGPIKVDGMLEEESWAKAPWTENFVDIEGPSRPKPRFRTRVIMLWDDNFLYIGAELEEPHIWATLTKRDSIIFYDNDFEVFIDPDGDTHNYYELEMNALNTVWDLFLVRPYRDGSPAVHSWDIQGLQTGVELIGTINSPRDEDEGWAVEIAMPWEVLKECAQPKSAPKPGDQWRVNFSRVEYRMDVEQGKYVKAKDKASGKPLAEDNWVWAPQGLINIHYPEMWGYVQFSDKIVGKGKESFKEKPEEKVKWVLRRIYYREWAYRAKQGSFSEDLGAFRLDQKELKLKGFLFPPQIQTTDNLFEVSYKSESGETYRISQDGRVWKD